MSQSVTPDNSTGTSKGFEQEQLDAISNLSASSDDLERLAESLTAQLQSVSQALQVVVEELDPDATVSELKTLQAAANSAEDELDELWESVQQVVSEFEQELAEAQSGFDATCEQAKGDLAEISEAIAALEETVAQTQQETEAELTGFTEAIAQLQSQVESFQVAIEADFEALSSDLSEVHTSAIENGFTDLIEQVSQTQLTELEGHFTHFSENITTLYSNFNQEVDGLGDQLQDRCVQLLQEVSQHCGEAAKSELEAAFQDLIEAAIAAMLEEVVQSIVLMTVGSSVTASISYSLPALVAAKKTAELVNDGLGAIGL